MYKVIAYHTDHPVYNEHAIRLVESLVRLGIPYEIEKIEDRGSWVLNCGYKPQFIQKHILMGDCPVVYVDIDAVFHSVPEFTGHVGAHLFRGKEILSGTLYFDSSMEARKVLSDWILAQAQDPLAWDQKNLQKVLGDFVNLPASYCKIFDKMPGVQPVIEHFQASRKVKRSQRKMIGKYPDKVGRVRIRTGADGSAYISRPDKDAIAYMDEHYDRVYGELRWMPRLPKGKTVNCLKHLFEGKSAYIVGKGPSLDNLRKEHFPDKDAPILAINEAIRKVEELHLPNPQFLIQFDTGLKDTCTPERAEVIVSHKAQYFFKRKYTFKPENYGLPGGTLTVLCAIEICKKLGSTDFVFVAFDACVNKRTGYALIVGKPSDSGGRNADRFLSHRGKINKQLHGWKSDWVIPTSPSDKSSDTLQQSQDSPEEHHESAPASPSTDYKDTLDRSSKTEPSPHASQRDHSDTQ